MSYQEITQYDSPNYTPNAQVLSVFGYPRNIVGVVYHWWGDPNAGATFNGVISWLCRRNGNSSAHTVGEGGRIAWLVNAWDAAWHAGHPRGNAQYVGYECNPRLSDADYETMGEFHYDMEKAYGRRLEIRLHKEFQATSCSPISVTRIRQIADRFHAGQTQPTPPPPPPAPEPKPEQPEWIKNLVKYSKPKELFVLPAEGVRVYNFVDKRFVNNNIIPKGTSITIVQETKVGGQKYYMSSYAMKNGFPWGIPVEKLGELVTPPENNKPEWLKNLKDIEDQDFWTRSETPVLNLDSGSLAEKLPINTKVRVTHSTEIVDIKLLVLEGQKTAIETIYLSNKPIPDPDDDLEEKNKKLLQQMVDFVKWVINKVKQAFK